MTEDRVRALVLYADSADASTLSYRLGWPRALSDHPAFDAELLDVCDASRRARLRRKQLKFSGFDVVLVLHSVFSNELFLDAELAERVRRSEQPKVYMPGNEYKLMPEKMAFGEAIGANLLVTQIGAPAAWKLYADRLGCPVAYVPNAGLDMSIFRPEVPRDERSIDIGYRGYRNPLYLGHDERWEIVDRIREVAGPAGLQLDLSLDPRDRLDERGWASFLNRCKAQLGSEAGGDYFELTDATRNAVNAFLVDNPGATIYEVRARFFAEYENPVPGRALSGRLVEAAGTKTVQILLEGEYGGVFRPDEHYIALHKDFANLGDALARLRDDAYCTQIAEAAYEVACSELSYERLVDRLYCALEPLLELPRTA
jgi:hypothetical protein